MREKVDKAYRIHSRVGELQIVQSGYCTRSMEEYGRR